MFIRAVISTTVLLTALTLAFTACGGGEPVSISTLASVPAPEPSYLTEEIPSCTPVGGSSVDPCEPGLVQTSGGMSRFIDSEPWSVRFFLGDERTSGVHAAHLVVRGTYLPDTVRCIGGDFFRHPPYTNANGWWGVLGTRTVNCYADVRVNAYILGSGPPTLTVMVAREYYWHARQQEFVEEVRSSLERVLIEGGDYGRTTVPSGGIAGREAVLFIGPSVDASVEAWRVFRVWDVQQREDGTAIAIHPDRDYWMVYHPDDYQTYRSSLLEMELPAFKQAVTAANQARITEYGGRIAPATMTGNRVGGCRVAHTGQRREPTAPVLHQCRRIRPPGRAAVSAACTLHMRQRYDGDGPRNQPGAGARLRCAAGGQGHAPGHRQPGLERKQRRHRLGGNHHRRHAQPGDQGGAAQREPVREHTRGAGKIARIDPPGPEPQFPDRKHTSGTGRAGEPGGAAAVGKQSHRVHPPGPQGRGDQRPVLSQPALLPRRRRRT